MDEDGNEILAVPRRRSNVIAVEFRPLIRVTADLHAAVDQSVSALVHDEDLYHRDGALVRVVRLGASEATAERPKGTPDIRAHSRATLRVSLSRCARYEKYDKRERKFEACAPPEDVAASVLDQGCWPDLRRLEGVIETPALRPDGSIISEPGWDAVTGLLYLPAHTFPPVPENPSQDEARAALEALREPFQDFPYAAQEHAMVPIAAILTILARAAINGSIPAFLFDASDRGAGKSLQVQVISRIATGRWNRPQTFPSKDGRVNEEELAKVLGSIAMAGSALVDFDNVRCVVDGAPLLAALTTIEEQEFRVLGASRMAKHVWRALVCMGGNNLAIGDEMARRCLVARAEPHDERPELRANKSREEGGFLHPRLRPWVAKDRERLVVAGLVMLRAWYAAGRPAQGCGTKASFEEWSDIIPHVIMFAGGPDVTTCVPQVEDADEDPTKASLRVLLAFWGGLDDGGEGLTVREALGRLYPNGKRPTWGHGDRDSGPDDGRDALRDAVEALSRHKLSGKSPTSEAFGKALRRLKGTKMGGKCLKTNGKDRSNVVRWRVQG